MFLDYAHLTERNFRVTKVEAAIVMKRTIAAENAVAALRDAIDGDRISFGPHIVTLEQAIGILRGRVIPRALLTIVEDDEM